MTLAYGRAHVARLRRASELRAGNREERGNVGLPSWEANTPAVAHPLVGGAWKLNRARREPGRYPERAPTRGMVCESPGFR